MIRLLAILFFTFAQMAFAQDSDTPQKQEKTVETPDTKDLDTKDNDFFDLGEAPTSYKGAFMKMMLTMLGLIVLIVISVWLLRRVSHGRMKQMNYGRSIKVIERRPLSAKSILYLVEISGKKVVIAESQVEVRGISTADHFTDSDA